METSFLGMLGLSLLMWVILCVILYVPAFLLVGVLTLFGVM